MSEDNLLSMNTVEPRVPKAEEPSVELQPTGGEQYEVTATLEKQNGSFGLSFNMTRTFHGAVVIDTVIDGTPAARDGRLRPGDTILMINDQLVSSGHAAVQQLLRDPGPVRIYARRGLEPTLSAAQLDGQTLAEDEDDPTTDSEEDDEEGEESYDEEGDEGEEGDGPLKYMDQQAAIGEEPLFRAAANQELLREVLELTLQALLLCSDETATQPSERADGDGEPGTWELLRARLCSLAGDDLRPPSAAEDDDDASIEDEVLLQWLERELRAVSGQLGPNEHGLGLFLLELLELLLGVDVPAAEAEAEAEAEEDEEEDGDDGDDNGDDDEGEGEGEDADREERRRQARRRRKLAARQDRALASLSLAQQEFAEELVRRDAPWQELEGEAAGRRGTDWPSGTAAEGRAESLTAEAVPVAATPASGEKAAAPVAAPDGSYCSVM